MPNCPACGANMRLADLHCQNAECIWLRCGSCKTLISDHGEYFGPSFWGNSNGYLKSE
jgi:hypothetical protein